MLSVHEIESMRRSHAMAPLPPSAVNELLEFCAQLARERIRIATLLSELPDTFAEVRKALNELHRLVTAQPVADAR